MIGLQHYEIAQWTNIGPWGGGEWARGTLKVNWSKLPNMKFSSKLNILNAALIFCARLRCLNCARKSMTNSASLGEMHRTRVSFVRRGACTQNLVLKIDRGTFSVCNIKNKKQNETKSKHKKAKMKLLAARPCFLFTVLLSTEDSSAVKMEKGNQNYAKLAFRSKNKIEYVRKMENMG